MDGSSTSDPEAYRRLFRREYAYVWNSLRRLGVPAADLEDVAHEVFLVVHLRLASYDPSRPLRPWLFGIAFRAVSQYRRVASRQREIATDTLDWGPGPSVSEEAIAARDLVLSALHQIEPDRRAVFILHDIDGYAVPEIADALAIPLNTAYSRLRRAREDFASIVAAANREIA